MKTEVKINDFTYIYDSKLTVIQACIKNQVDVPRFCYHESLSIAGNCRMCLVEDMKQLKPLASCAINISSGMSIYTNTLKVKKARESVLEFLLANHPLDCPICDQGGECDLQDQAIVFGSDRGRFYEFKRSVEDKDCGPLVKTIMNRCIHCTRCVRFSTEIAGFNSLGITGRGSKMEIGFYVEKMLNNELSGNVIDLCPVGALTSKPFSFTSRPWELKSFNSIDIFDSTCSNTRVDIRGNKVMRVLPRFNLNINKDWIADKVRFNYDGLRKQRLSTPLVRVSNTLVKVEWPRVTNTLKLFFSSINFISKQLPLTINIGDFIDLETVLTSKKLSSILGLRPIHQNFDQRFFVSTKKLETNNGCLLIDVNLRLHLPILNLFLRQLWIKKNLLFYTVGYYSSFNYYVKHLSTNQKCVMNIVEGSHWICSKLKNMQSVLVFVSSTYFSNNTTVFSNFEKLHVINSSVSFFSAYELGFSALKTYPTNSIQYMLNADYRPVESTNKIIYQGHHGDSVALLANLVLPSSIFLEKISTYVNYNFLIQRTTKILPSYLNARSDWEILNFVSEVLNLTLNLSKHQDVIFLLKKISPLANLSNFNFAVSNNKYLTKLFNYPFNSISNTYYLSDIISRASKTMALCQLKFKAKNSFSIF
jgi:NADH dehydrogenase (ubiquinone) Fe-S protein 1